LLQKCSKNIMRTHHGWGSLDLIHVFMKDALLPFDFGDVLLLLLENCPLEAKYCHKYGDRLKQNVTEREACIDGRVLSSWVSLPSNCGFVV